MPSKHDDIVDLRSHFGSPFVVTQPSAHRGVAALPAVVVCGGRDHAVGKEPGSGIGIGAVSFMDGASCVAIPQCASGAVVSQMISVSRAAVPCPAQAIVRSSAKSARQILVDLAVCGT